MITAMNLVMVSPNNLNIVTLIIAANIEDAIKSTIGNAISSHHEYLMQLIIIETIIMPMDRILYKP
jgi:hypothetical protein